MIQTIPKEKKINVSIKSNELLSILSKSLDDKINLARIKLITLKLYKFCHFICALYKVQTVTYSKLARAFDTRAKEYSSLRRIKRFISNYQLCPDLIARFIHGLLPRSSKYKLTIHRTNWKFDFTDMSISYFYC